MENPRIGNTLVHAPGFGVRGGSIGGAEEAFREMTRHIGKADQLSGALTFRHPGRDHRFNPETYIDPRQIRWVDHPYTNERGGYVSGDALLHHPELAEKMIREAQELARKSSAMIANYYIAIHINNEALHATEIRPLELVFGHTWGLSAAINNPLRSPVSDDRNRIEFAALNRAATGNSILCIQTAAEALQLHDLYHLPGTSQDFVDRSIIVPLGVQPEFFEMGRMRAEQPEVLKANGLKQLEEKLREQGQVENARRIAEMDRNIKVISTIGALREGKGHEELLDGFIKALENEPHLPAALFLVGGELEGNPVYARLLERLSQTNEDIRKRVFMLDSQLDTDIIPVTDIAVVGSRRESFSLFNAKAMAANLATIINGDPIISEAAGFHVRPANDRPLQFDPNNTSQLAEEIQYLVTHPEEARLIAESNYQYARTHLTWNTVTNQFLTQLQAKIG